MVDTEDKLDSHKPAEQQQYATYDYSIPYGSSYLANLTNDFTRSADSNEIKWNNFDPANDKPSRYYGVNEGKDSSSYGYSYEQIYSDYARGF